MMFSRIAESFLEIISTDKVEEKFCNAKFVFVIPVIIFRFNFTPVANSSKIKKNKITQLKQNLLFTAGF